MSMISTSGQASGTEQTAKSRPDAAFEPQVLKILIIDDDGEGSMLVEQSMRYLSRFEPLITVAGTLAAARFAMRMDRFDLVLLDCDFATAEGPGLLGEIMDGTRAETLPAAKVVVMASEPSAAIERAALAGGATACIAKDDIVPIEIERILAGAGKVPKVATQARRAEPAQSIASFRTSAAVQQPVPELVP